MNNKFNLSEIHNSKDAIAAGLPVFKIFSDGALVAIKGAGSGDKLRVKLTASTSAMDLEGDIFSKSALTTMEKMAPGTTMFLNHDFKVPESVFGMVESAELVSRKVDGQTVLCLEYIATVAASNPRAMQTYDQIAKGEAKLGVSITALVAKTLPGERGKRLIDDVYYLEASIVGVPCNQQSWVATAQKSLTEMTDEAFKELAPPSPLPFPIAKRETRFNRTVAEKNIREWAASKGDTVGDAGHYDGLFFDEDDQLRHLMVDIVEGAPHFIPAAIFRSAGEVSRAKEEAMYPILDAAYAGLAKEFADTSIVTPWTPNKKDLAAFITESLATKATTAAEVVKAVTDIAEAGGLTIIQAHAVLSGEYTSLTPKALAAFSKALGPNVETLALEAGLFTEGQTTGLVEKGMYARELKERTSSIYFLTGILENVLWALMSTARWGEKVEVDYIGEASLICDEFKFEVMTKLVPQMLAVSAEVPDAEYEMLMDSILGFDPEGVWKFVNELYAKSPIIGKAGARNSKLDSKRIQGIHDYSVELAAKCVTEKGVIEAALGELKAAAISSESLTATAASKALSAENEQLKGEIARLTALNEQWETTALIMKTTITALADQPMPRAGV